MKITEISIKKPIAVIMLIILVFLLGTISYINTGSDLYPPINIPVIVIHSSYHGAGSEEIHKDIIKPIEDAVSGVNGVDYVRSTAVEGSASTIIIFKLSANTTNAFIDVQKAVEGITYKLPKDADKPTVLKFDQNAMPIFTVSISGDKEYEQLYNDAENLKEIIARVPGVGNVNMSGGMEKQLQINIDKSKLDFYGLTINQIVGRLQSENLTMPGGKIKQSEQDKTIQINGEFKDVSDIKKFRIPLKGGFVQLEDIADISLAYPDATDISRTDKGQCITLSVQKQSDANIVATGDKVKKEIEKFKPTVKGTNINILEDATIYIRGSLNETQRNLIEGVIITSFVLLIFLRQFSSMFIVLVSIPVSLVATFFMMFMFKFTFNMLSLMGLALCVGILVDDSVVILENINRHLKMGKDPKKAALDGRTEIGMAAIAITLCDVVVFAPIAFMSGIVGQYFKQFGLTVVFATLFSLLVSFTVTPMLASRLFKRNLEMPDVLKDNFIKRFLNKIGFAFLHMYQAQLKWALKHRLTVLFSILVLIIVAVSLIPMGFIGAEFMPKIDSGEFTLNVELASGLNLENTNSKIKTIENYLLNNIPEFDYYITHVGVDGFQNKGSIYVKLKDKKLRKRSYKVIMDQVRNWTQQNLSGVKLQISEANMGGGPDSNKPIIVNIKGDKSEVLNQISKEVERIVKETPGTVEVSNSLASGQPELTIQIDRLACAKYGFTVSDVASTVRASVDGSSAGVYRKDGDEYDIKVKINPSQLRDENSINTLKVTNNQGITMTLDQLTNAELSQSPAQINTKDKQRLATISASLRPGYTTGAVNAEIQKKLNSLHLMNGYSLEFGGEQQDMEETFSSLIQALIMSVALVYIVLVVLYESFLTPFVRLLALPVGMVGALILLAITRNSLNMFSMIGLIMLDGLAAKNGTLLIDYTNTLMETKGLSLKEALYEAGSTRLKPIYMTSVAMIFGMLPTAIAIGDGAEIKASMAIVIIGGIISSTLLSPILIPVAYTLLDDMKRFLVRKLFRRKVKEAKLVSNIHLEPETDNC